MSVKNLLVLVVFYLALGFVLWGAALQLAVHDMAVVTSGLVGIGTGFFVLTAGEMFLADYMRRRNPEFLVSALIGAKSVRLLLTLFAVAAYGFLGAPEFLPFALNIVVFYVAALIYTTVFNMRKNKS